MKYKIQSYSADIWAFGCILGEVVLGKPYLFGGANEREVLDAQAKVILSIYSIHSQSPLS